MDRAVSFGVVRERLLRERSWTTEEERFRGQEMAGKGKSSGAGDGTRGHQRNLKKPSGTSVFLSFRHEALDPLSLVVKSGSTELRYHLQCINDLHSMLKSRGEWMLLGSADEQKPAAEGTIEAWGRSSKNPVGGWYGLKKGLRGRFGMYVPPVLEVLHWPKSNTTQRTTG